MKSKFKFALLWIIFSVLFLCVIQILFSIPAPAKWLEAVWTAGDLISFIGTVVLGCITVWQTKRANEVSLKLIEIENNRDKLETQPFVMIIDYQAYNVDWQTILNNPEHLYYIAIGDLDNKNDLVALALTFQNTTESFLTLEYKKEHLLHFTLIKVWLINQILNYTFSQVNLIQLFFMLIVQL